MPGNYTITTRATGTILTAAIYNSDHQNHVDNCTPQGVGGYSSNTTQMAIKTDPGATGSESLAGSAAGELERLRFCLARLGGTTKWYDPPTIVNVKTYLPVGDGIADDRAAFVSAAAAAQGTTGATGAVWSNGLYLTGGAAILPNNVDQVTLTKTDRFSALGLFEGSSANPSVSQEPVLWVQKYVKKDTGAAVNHQVGGAYIDLEIQGSGVAAANKGTWYGLLVNVDSLGVNTSVPATPAFDIDGDVIGIAAFARMNGVPGQGRILSGIWAYPEGPSADATTIANTATSWAICGLEVNLKLRHVDPGKLDVFSGKGVNTGVLLYNFRATGAGIFDWSFGLVLDGSPNDGNFTGTDFSLWSGFHTGIHINLCRDRGILFGKYFGANAYGIEFPSTYAGFTTRPKAAMFLGDNVINMGTYTGAVFNDNDLFMNAGQLIWRTGGAGKVVMGSMGVGTSGSYVGTKKIHITLGGVDYYVLAADTP